MGVQADSTHKFLLQKPRNAKSAAVWVSEEAVDTGHDLGTPVSDEFSEPVLGVLLSLLEVLQNPGRSILLVHPESII